jgi:hypothetical protein
LYWILILDEFGVTFEYLPIKKNVTAVAYDLSHLDIDSLMIQEKKRKEEALILLSGPEHRSIINSKLTIPMHTSFIYKVQETDKNQD